MSDVRQLPPGWNWSTLGEIAEIRGGIQKQPKRAPKDNAYPFLRVANVARGSLNLEDVHRVELFGNELATYALKKGDLLIVEGNGSPSEIGRAAIWNGSIDNCVHQNHLIRARPHHGLVPEFVEAYWNSTAGTASVKEVSSSTSGLHTLSVRKVSQVPVPIAPVAEQRSIVAEIEKQFTRLDASVLLLHQAQRKLAVCRRAVLQAAIQGGLTNATETSRNWPWVPLGDLADASPNAVTDGPFGSNLKTEHYTNDGPRVIRLQNIGDGKFIDQLACISEAHFERLQKHAVESGDLLIAALGNELPRACVAPDNLGPAIVKADCIRFRPAAAQVSTRYLCHALNSHSVRTATRELVHGVGRPRLNLSGIKSILIPLPPMNDQLRIVEAVEDKLSLIDSVEGIVRTSLQRADRLRQSILKHAFEGKLALQGASDKAATAFLARINAGRS